MGTGALARPSRAQLGNCQRPKQVCIRYEGEVSEKSSEELNTNRRLLVLFLLLSLVAAAPAQARNWRITDFKDTISIAADGTALVSEKITLAFVGEWHGIHRTIPVEYPGPDGTNYTLFVDVMSVTDENGNKLKYDSSKSGAIAISRSIFPARSTLRASSTSITPCATVSVSSTVTTSSTGT